MAQHWRRALVPTAVLTLLVLAMKAPPRVSAERASDSAAGIALSPCSPVQSGNENSGSLVTIHPGDAVLQPIAVIANVSRCSLSVNRGPWTRTAIDFAYWDPQALAPDPTTVLLRTGVFPATSVAYGTTTAQFVPTLVLETVAKLADPPPTEAVFVYRSESGDDFACAYEADDPSVVPTGLFAPAGAAAQSLPGTHAVLGHQICGDPGASSALRVVQCVMRTDAQTAITDYEYIQKFRVPVNAYLGWVELANVPNNASGYGLIQVFDAAGATDPGLDLGPPLLEEGFSPVRFEPSQWRPQWPSNDNGTPALHAGHDYWLVVRTSAEFAMYAHAIGGTEGPDFAAGIGGLYRRPAQGAAAEPLPGLALSFRLIGEPTGALDVPPSPPRAGSFQLAASPNPSRDAISIRWTGARSDVRFEVMDARGRRVSSGAARVGASGDWRWNGRGDDGGALPAGMYFVRARDASGRSASVRVTLVH